MEFWASVEGHQPAYVGLAEVRRLVEPYLNAAFAGSILASLACKVRYVPIVMPVGMRERYPARSRLVKKDSVYDCAPQLDYQTFVDGSLEDRLAEYLRGIAPSAGRLVALGASKEQVAEFERIIAGAADQIVARSSGAGSVG